MFTCITDGITLPEIKHKYNWYLKDYSSHIITYIHEQDIKSVGIHPKRPHYVALKQAAFWETSESATLLGYLHAVEELGSLPLMSLDHVLWITKNKQELLNTTEKNDKGDYIGNFFFIPKNEFQKQDNVWTSDPAIASIMRRNNTPKLEFGLRFYNLNDPRIWKAKGRRIITLS